MRLLSLAVAAGAGGAAASPALLEDTLAARLVACTVCHGEQGRAAPDGYHPRIAGKPAGYLYNQLLHFRDGRRFYGPMVALAAPLSDAYLRDIARHFAALDLPYGAPEPSQADAATLARGRLLALRGDDSRGLPACQACHGATLTGRAPATPGLLGLPLDYLTGQLGAWVNGQRRAHAPDCMGDIARRLAGPDLNAVAAWLAVQPVPAGAPIDEAPAVDHALPLECGTAVMP